MRPRGCLSTLSSASAYGALVAAGMENSAAGCCFPQREVPRSTRKLRWHTPLMWAQAGRSNAVFICELGYVLNHFAICCSGVVVRTQKRIILAGKGCHGDEKQSVHTIVHAK